MTRVLNVVLRDIGLDKWPPVARDKLFWLAIVIGVPVWVLLWLTAAPTFTIRDRSIISIVLVSSIYYPVLEEILFRGVVQGWLSGRTWGSKRIVLFSAANWLTSLLFVAAHFWYQPMLWALMVIVPSLVYGYFRDRFSNIYPSIILHAYYNAGFVCLNLLAQ